MAREEGFEPPNARTKTWCLTTWRLPNVDDAFNDDLMSYSFWQTTPECPAKAGCLTTWRLPNIDDTFNDDLVHYHPPLSRGGADFGDS